MLDPLTGAVGYGWQDCSGRSLICHSVPLSGDGCGAGRAGRAVGRETDC
jgi:hypothetical protein